MTAFPVVSPAVPEIFLACAAMVLLMMGVFRGEGNNRAVAQAGVLVLVVAAVLVGSHAGVRQEAFNGQFVMDGFAVFMKLLCLIGGAASLILSMGYMERERMDRFEFPVLVVLATLGMMMMLSANDLIALYLGIEVQSLCLYVLAAFRRDATRSSEAGLKYFVLGALSSGLFLFGASLIYGFTGNTGFPQIAAAIGGHPQAGLVVGMVFVAAGMCFKMSAAPFHMWTPDVYEGAPTPITAFFAAAPKVAAMGMMIRFFVEPFGGMADQWKQVVVFAAVLSMVIGAYTAISQTNIKRMMAYSSIGHVGYALLGLTAGGKDGVTAVILYLAVYIAMSLGTFGVILCMRQNGRMVEEIRDLSGMAKTHPLLSIIMTIFMFSMAGIPPLAGFFGKLYVLMAAVQAGYTTVAIIAVLTSVVGAFYYLRIIKVMYFEDVGESLDRHDDDGVSAVLAVSGLFILLFFVYPSALISAAGTAAAALFPA